MTAVDRAVAESSASIEAAVAAARNADVDQFTEACARLGAADAERVGTLQAAVIRSLLEELHPDGLDAEDVRLILTRCDSASSWLPTFDGHAALMVLAGALGMTEPDEQPPAPRDLLISHACVVITDLCAVRPRMLVDHLRTAIDEIRRAETIEMP